MRAALKWIFRGLAYGLLCGVCVADLGFAPILNDGAVLQCEMPINVWGTADPGAMVEVRLDGRNLATTSVDASGDWKAVLPEQEAGGPHRVEVLSGQASAEIKAVWFGEVWLASGQSNMEMALRNTFGGEAWLKATQPEIRFAIVPKKTGLPVSKNYTTLELAWKTFEPGSNGRVSAVAFYFAEEIQKATGHKVGIIQSAYGGTPAEAWTPTQALEACPELEYFSAAVRKGVSSGRSEGEWTAERDAFSKRWKAFHEWEKTKAGTRPPSPGILDKGNPWSQHTATVLYENMIAPLVPYTTRGVIWYQGENNAGRPDEYRILFPAMIEAWRTAWKRPAWPFYFVQLAAFGHPSRDWSGLRAAQTFTRDTIANTGMALAIDLGEENDIHPRAKQSVGERLARLALEQVYGQNTVSRGPAFKTLEIQKSRVVVRFSHEESGLQTSDGKEAVPGFEVAGADGVFQSAKARIILENTVEVRFATIAEPVSVRYAWASWIDPPVTLQNSAGLPAEPFEMNGVKIGEKRNGE